MEKPLSFKYLLLPLIIQLFINTVFSADTNCPANCSECLETEVTTQAGKVKNYQCKQCKTCGPGRLTDKVNRLCKDCEAGYYYSSVDEICVKCHFSCSTCGNSEYDSCLSCSDTRDAISGSCRCKDSSSIDQFQLISCSVAGDSDKITNSIIKMTSILYFSIGTSLTSILALFGNHYLFLSFFDSNQFISHLNLLNQFQPTNLDEQVLNSFYAYHYPNLFPNWVVDFDSSINFIDKPAAKNSQALFKKEGLISTYNYFQFNKAYLMSQQASTKFDIKGKSTNFLINAGNLLIFQFAGWLFVYLLRISQCCCCAQQELKPGYRDIYFAFDFGMNFLLIYTLMKELSLFIFLQYTNINFDSNLNQIGFALSVIFSCYIIGVIFFFYKKVRFIMLNKNRYDSWIDYNILTRHADINHKNMLKASQKILRIVLKILESACLVFLYKIKVLQIFAIFLLRVLYTGFLVFSNPFERRKVQLISILIELINLSIIFFLMMIQLTNSAKSQTMYLDSVKYCILINIYLHSIFIIVQFIIEIPRMVRALRIFLRQLNLLKETTSTKQKEKLNSLQEKPTRMSSLKYKSNHLTGSESMSIVPDKEENSNQNQGEVNEGIQTIMADDSAENDALDKKITQVIQKKEINYLEPTQETIHRVSDDQLLLDLKNFKNRKDIGILEDHQQEELDKIQIQKKQKVLPSILQESQPSFSALNNSVSSLLPDANRSNEITGGGDAQNLLPIKELQEETIRDDESYAPSHISDMDYEIIDRQKEERDLTRANKTLAIEDPETYNNSINIKEESMLYEEQGGQNSRLAAHENQIAQMKKNILTQKYQIDQATSILENCYNLKRGNSNNDTDLENDKQSLFFSHNDGLGENTSPNQQINKFSLSQEVKIVKETKQSTEKNYFPRQQ